MTTQPLSTWIGNAAAVFSKVYGAVIHQAQQVGCSRQTVYQHARQLEQRLDVTAMTNSWSRISGFAIRSPP